MTKKNEYGHYGWTIVGDLMTDDKVVVATLETRDEYRLVKGTLRSFIFYKPEDADNFCASLNDDEKRKAMRLGPIKESLIKTYIGGQKLYQAKFNF